MAACLILICTELASVSSTACVNIQIDMLHDMWHQMLRDMLHDMLHGMLHGVLHDVLHDRLHDVLHDMLHDMSHQMLRAVTCSDKAVLWRHPVMDDTLLAEEPESDVRERRLGLHRRFDRRFDRAFDRTIRSNL